MSFLKKVKALWKGLNEEKIVSRPADESARDRTEDSNEARLRLFFDKCEENRIRSINTEENRKNALLIAKSLGIEDAEGALVPLEEHLNKQARLQQERKMRENRREYENEKKLACITGKEKYTFIFADRLIHYYEKLTGEKARQDRLIGNAVAAENEKVKKTDAFVAGGIAQGIAGPVAGVFAALEAQKNNLRMQRQHADRVNMNRAAASLSQVLINDINLCIDHLHQPIRMLADLLCDTTEPDEKFLKVQFDPILIHKLKPEKMVLHIRTRVDEAISIANTPAVLDGSVRIVVMHGEEEIGDAYYSAMGAGDPAVEFMGFGAKVSGDPYFPATAIPFEGKRFYPTVPYSFRIEPISIWAIEAEGCWYWSDYTGSDKAVRDKVWKGIGETTEKCVAYSLQKLPNVEGTPMPVASPKMNREDCPISFDAQNAMKQKQEEERNNEFKERARKAVLAAPEPMWMSDFLDVAEGLNMKNSEVMNCVREMVKEKDGVIKNEDGLYWHL